MANDLIESPPSSINKTFTGEHSGLDANVIPAATRACANCKSPMKGPFCYQCGQHERGSIRHFGLLLRDIIHDVFDLDSRMVRTLKPLLLNPGFLTNEYFAGRRQRYVPPLRLYVIASLLFFLLINFLNPLKDADFSFKGDELVERVPAEEVRKNLSEEDKAKLKEALADPELEQAMKMTGIDLNKALQPPEAPEIKEALVDEAREKKNFSGITLNDTGAKFTLISPSPIFPESWNHWITENNEKVSQVLTENPKLVLDAALSVLPQSMFIVLPIFALLLKLMYPFSNRYYIEHLMVAFHSHSFLYVALMMTVGFSMLQDSLLIALPALTQLDSLFNVIFTIMILWLPAYLLIMQKRVYNQGWWLTLFKWQFLGLIYIVLLAFTILIDIFISALNH